MPIYEYKCTNCDAHFERLQGMDEPDPPCPMCGSAVQKQMSATGGIVVSDGGQDQGQRCCSRGYSCDNPKRCCEN